MHSIVEILRDFVALYIKLRHTDEVPFLSEKGQQTS